MDSIVYRQRSAAQELTFKGLVLGMAEGLLRLSAAQIVIGLLVVATGAQILNALVYLYAAWLLFDFVRGTASCCVYTLKTGSLILERSLGDSTMIHVEIPVEHMAAMRPMKRGERLQTTYRKVRTIDPKCRQALRVRAAFVLSLFSAHLARRCAGKRIEETIGHVVVFDEGDQRCACVFAPDKRMCEALETLLGDAYGFDERMTHARVSTLYGRALERAFPALYPYVDPLVKQEEVEWARGEVERQKTKKKKPQKAGINDEIHDDSL